MGPRYLLAALILAAGAAAQPRIAGCPVFPADSAWNTPIDHLPVDPASAAYISSLGPSSPMHPDFGSGLFNGGPIGIPFIVVPGSTPKIAATFEYAGESDPGPYAVPLDAPIEGGAQSTGDRHAIAIDRDNCILYELFDARPQSGGTWRAGSGAIFDLRSNRLRPAGWTSADAAGLAIVPGLVRYDEVAAGEIAHAIRFTVRRTRRAYVWPARHFASSSTDPQLPPMGQRFRLRSGYDITGFHPENQVVLRALKKYGIILADNGSDLFISGEPDERWNNMRLRELRRVTGADFEAVDASGLMIDAGSGQARRPAGALLHGATFEAGPVAPNLIVSLFGMDLADANVEFDNVAATLLFRSPAQVNAVVPASVRGTARLRVTRQDGLLWESSVPVAASAPGIFGVLNQDYTLNSESNPSPPGGVLVLFGTGGGIGQRQSVSLDGAEATLFYAGASPQFPGVDQLNFAATAGPGRRILTWTAGERSAAAHPVWLR